MNAGAVSRYCRILRSFSNGHSTFFQVMNSLTCLASSQNFWNKSHKQETQVRFQKNDTCLGVCSTPWNALRAGLLRRQTDVHVLLQRHLLSVGYNLAGCQWRYAVTNYVTHCGWSSCSEVWMCFTVSQDRTQFESVWLWPNAGGTISVLISGQCFFHGNAAKCHTLHFNFSFLF